MNYENEGEPIAIIKDDDKPKNIKVVCVDNNNNSNKTYNEIILKDNQHFQQIPDVKKERSILYITGKSGSGKSYYTYMYACEYKKIYPKRSIYLFSSLSDDKGSIDKIKGLKKIKLNDEFLNDMDEITAEDFKESLVIFDDVDALINKRLKIKVMGILNSILQVGRHHAVSCVYTSHVPNAGNETKMILNEAHSITYFPLSLGGRTLDYLLRSYMGFDKKQIEKLKKIKSRWITVVKSYPNIILSEKEAYNASEL